VKLYWIGRPGENDSGATSALQPGDGRSEGAFGSDAARFLQYAEAPGMPQAPLDAFLPALGLWMTAGLVTGWLVELFAKASARRR
jgi:hypothetical protein